MKKMLIFVMGVFFIFYITIFFVACTNEVKDNDIIPENIKTENDGVPILKIYNTSTKELEEENIENYLFGVLAGEMYNNFELEALKAQAILARTYALDFIKNKTSKYEGADISNDINEAQAYDRESINDNIRKAVSETKGKVVLKNGELIKAWFHANSGGVTTTASNGLSYKETENFTKSVVSPENDENSKNYSWGVVFKKTEILEALRELGKSTDSCSNFYISEKDESGRAKTIHIGDVDVSANEFRLKIGSTKMKSTLITNIKVYANTIYIEGRGYGHGVGMSQWGANVLANQGKSAEEIINYYFKDVEIMPAY